MDSLIGKIHSVSCQNFVTYDEITIFPGAYLNLILGPNGTGKSSLVAAIVLGMGGEPKLLSRSSDIRDYVKNGKDNSWIEVKIYVKDDGTTATFRRSFDLTGKSIYKVNDTKMTHKQYVKNIAEYDIQIDNPCQFLPQDRVQDFAKMNAQELLNSTQMAVCTQEMIDHFNKLKELRTIQLGAHKNFVDNQKRLKELEERNALLENIIEQMQIRQRFLDEIKVGEKKKAWLEFDELKKDFDKIQELLKTAQYNLNRDEKIFNESKKRSKNVIDLRTKLESTVSSETKEMAAHSNQLDKLEENIGEYENALQSAERDLKSKKADMAERESEIQNAGRLLEAFTQDLKVSLEGCAGYKEELANFNDQINGKKREIITLNEKRSDLNYEIDRYQPELNAIRSRISKMQNESERRLNNIRNLQMDVYTAVVWLHSNRHVFEGRIYDPMLLELHVKDAKNAKYVENTINIRDLFAFTCVKKSDVSLLVQKLCVEKKLKINVLHSDEATSCHYRPETPINQLKKYGFYSYILDMIEGPAPILNYLCQAVHVHKILVATDEVERHVDNLPQNITFFYSTHNKFRIVISRYSNEKSSMSSSISEKNLLCTQVDERQINELKSRLVEITTSSDALKNRRNDIESKISEHNEEVNEIVKMKARLEGKLNHIQEKKRKVHYQEQKITQLQNTIIDIPEEEKKFETLLNELIRKMVDAHRKKVNCLTKYQKAKELKEYTSTKLFVYKNETIDIDNQLKAAEEDFQNAKKRVDALVTTRLECTKKCDEKQLKAKQLCDGKDRNHRSFPYREQFAKLADTLTELEEHLIEIKIRADCMTEHEADIREYENRKKEIQTLQQILNSVQSEHDVLQTEITAIHEIWFTYFMEKIVIINDNFSKFMAIMEYAGEVNLKYNDVHDYASYGIEILVQYRNSAKLQALDRFIQSGGERAVAIAIYSMSLQNITHVPFRCVDEINQGMDPENERKVFNLIVDETCKVGSSQYFFITPKLLPDLHYNDLLTAIVVFNGKLSATDIFNYRL